MRLARFADPVTLTLALLTAPLATDAQPAKVPRVGYVFGVPSAESRHLLEAFRRGLRELGYVEGWNVALEGRWAEGQSDRLPELVRLPVDVLVVESGLAGLAAKKATQTIPIVMAPVGDPVGSGLVASLGRPGGNITGKNSGIEVLKRLAKALGVPVTALLE
jgi:putative ABC transport system substrate-binding protein